MTLLTGLAMSRRSVTVLLIALVLLGGSITYRTLKVELFPPIEFPLVTIVTFYPSANPEAVVRDVTAPIESVISGMAGLENIQSTSSENLSLLLANFKFGTDMAEAERTISGRLTSLTFPSAVNDPTVARISPDEFPVLQFSILGERDILDLQRITESLIRPAILGVDGVFSADITGGSQEQIVVSVDSDLLTEFGVSLFQVSSALRDNNISLPAGTITENGRSLPVRTVNSYTSIDQIKNLAVGFSGPTGFPSTPPAEGEMTSEPQSVLLSSVASVTIEPGVATSISRTNGRPSLGIGVVKDPDSNTVEVTEGVLEALASLGDLPADIEIVTVFNDGPEIQAQIDSLQQEAILGFIFAMIVVFVFLLTVRPTLLKGLRLTLMPTMVIGLSIPLSILIGILLMASQGMSLNFMTLGGLAISVGRVVDDSIVVLENVYRHMQRGEDRYRVALEATREVAPAITASTLTTIAVFVPLGFIQGLVGSFFTPFALTVSFALAGSLFVSLTAVPVLGAILLRPGDLPDSTGEGDEIIDRETWMQKLYTPILVWGLRHKAATLVIALVITAGSLGLLAVIPVSLFPSGGARLLTIDMTLPPGTSQERTIDEVNQLEGTLGQLKIEGAVETYVTTIGNPTNSFGPGAGVGGSGRASILVLLTEDAPENIVERLRSELGGDQGRRVNITEVSGGPPTSGLEVSVTGSDYSAVSGVANLLAAQFAEIDGIVNVSSNVAESRDEIIINVLPAEAAKIGLSARLVAFQVNQFLVGQPITEVNLDSGPMTVILKGNSAGVNEIDGVKNLIIAGQMGTAKLGDIADVTLAEGPVTISRSDGVRSASITGAITGDDTRAIGTKIQERIDSIDMPAGVSVSTGGVFQQIAEGFQDIFLAMAVGIVLVYLVMAASLGSLRNPFVVIMSLPLALIGALAALAITGRSLGLPAMMGILLLIGIVVTNAIVLISFVEQLRERGLSLHDALVQGGRIRLRPILMTTFTTSFALVPLAALSGDEGGIIGAELATVVIGGLMSSTFLTLIVVPIVYSIMHVSLPGFFRSVEAKFRRDDALALEPSGD
ncbi:MAG: efflux RND transporter permease subunit [Chloroflexi bacterium]|nr:efflux RND transporter permease subunit [Chloroflexota bacterium]